MESLELYRKSTAGMCLIETLDEMVSNETLSPELAIQVLVQFDMSMAEALKTQVKDGLFLAGHLDSYRYVDSVWTFILHDALFEDEQGRQATVDRVKIVACDSKLFTDSCTRRASRNIDEFSYEIKKELVLTDQEFKEEEAK